MKGQKGSGRGACQHLLKKVVAGVYCQFLPAPFESVFNSLKSKQKDCGNLKVTAYKSTLWRRNWQYILFLILPGTPVAPFQMERGKEDGLSN